MVLRMRAVDIVEDAGFTAEHLLLCLLIMRRGMKFDRRPALRLRDGSFLCRRGHSPFHAPTLRRFCHDFTSHREPIALR